MEQERELTFYEAWQELADSVDTLYHAIAGYHPIIRFLLWILSRPKRQFLLVWAILCSLVLLITLIAKRG